VIDIATIRRVPIFGSFSDAEAAAVCSTVADRRFGRHEFIVRENDPGDRFFFITEGSVAVCRTLTDGRETILSILKEGEFFGEMSMFDSSLRSASIKTLTETEVWAITRENFLDMLDRNPRVSRLLAMALSERLRAANTLVATTTAQDARARVAALLLNLSERFGEPAENGIRITLRLTNVEMAHMIGTSRETVNRILNRFWDERLVDRRSSRLIVVDPDGLRALL
jgi:CRP/FNR family cyclic AMP-dependent transcriptional regulator